MSTAPVATIVVLGPPGAGKSSICAAICERYDNARSFAVRLRHEALLREGHQLGLRIQDSLSRGGRYIPTSLVGALFAHFLAEQDHDALILLEGFPINRAQLDVAGDRLAEVGRRIDRLLDVRVDRQVALDRVARRRVCASCERAAVAGRPVPPDAVSCPRCGGPLVRRLDDGIAATRLVDFAAEHAAIVGAVPPQLIACLDVTALSPPQAVAGALALLDLP